MDCNIYIETILNGFCVEDYYYIIFGTGEVADIFYDKMKEEGATDRVLGFINEQFDMDEYHGKPVMKCDTMPQEYIIDEQVKYIVGTVSKIPLFLQRLEKVGIPSDRIITGATMFSVDCFEEDEREIKRIVLYPPITSTEVLTEQIKDFVDVQHIEELDIIYMVDNKDNFKEYDKQIHLQKISEYAYCPGDLTWVWDVDYIADDLVKNSPWAICCDNAFLWRSVERMHVLLNDKFYKNDWKQLSSQNYSKMLDKVKQYEHVTVCGMGPSLLTLDEDANAILRSGCRIVCNGFYKAQCDWIPHLYVLQDSNYLTETHREITDGIIQYIVKNNIFLVVDSMWFNTFLVRYPEVRDWIIASERKDKPYIPVDGQLGFYEKNNNVIPGICLSLAFGMADTVYVAGCDGSSQNGDWKHADGQVLKNDAFQGDAYKVDESKNQVFLISTGVFTLMEYTHYVDDMLEGIIGFAEGQGKRCYSLTKSAYSSLRKRMRE